MGFKQLDERSGMAKARYFILGARQKMGKTLRVTTADMASEEFSVVMFSLKWLRRKLSS